MWRAGSCSGLTWAHAQRATDLYLKDSDVGSAAAELETPRWMVVKEVEKSSETLVRAVSMAPNRPALAPPAELDGAASTSPREYEFQSDSRETESSPPPAGPLGLPVNALSHEFMLAV
jgi:hypothetical protein